MNFQWIDPLKKNCVSSIKQVLLVKLKKRQRRQKKALLFKSKSQASSLWALGTYFKCSLELNYYYSRIILSPVKLFFPIMFHIIYIFQIMDHNYFSPELPTSPTRAPVDMHEPLSSPPVPTTPVPVLYPESETLFSTPVRKPTIPLPFFNKSFSSTSPDHSTPDAQPPILSPPSDNFLNSTPNSNPTNPSPRSRSSSPVADSGPSPVADSGQPAVLTCKFCLQAFKHSQSAWRHEREKHGEKRYRQLNNLL